MENLLNLTVGEVVARDFRNIGVFQKLGIDFCCGGSKKIEQVCKEKGISLEDLQRALGDASFSTPFMAPRFNTWKLDFLMEYILNNHHLYVKETMPELQRLLQKIARVHGPGHPELVEISNLFDMVVRELETHLKKEEEVFFPYVKDLLSGESLPSQEKVVFEMEEEHTKVGDALHTIAKLSQNYAVPADSCNTYRYTFEKLKEFEEDIHHHVHLENNILFPKALGLEKSRAMNI